MPKDQNETIGYRKLMEILSTAVSSGADTVEMEYDSGHSLEVCFMVGNSGAGYMLDRDTAGALIDSLWEEKRKGHGKFRITLEGTDYMVSVKTRDHFGENAYTLSIRKAQRASARGKQ